MAKEEFRKIQLMTPKAPVAFCALAEPFHSDKYNNDSYSCDLVFDPEDEALIAFRNTIQKFGEERLAELLLDPEETKLILPIKKQKDKDGNETGMMLLRTRKEASFTPKKTATNPKPKPIPKRVFFRAANGKDKIEPMALGRGSVVRIAVDVSTSYRGAEEDDEKGKLRVSLRPMICQVIDPVPFGEPDPDAYGMQEEEGYEAPEGMTSEEGDEDSVPFG